MSAQDYDSQLLESVSVRRRRLRDAVLFGGQRQRRTVDERLGKVFAGVVIAAVLCAGCVGWSFVSHRVLGQSGQSSNPYGTSTMVPSSPPTQAPTGASSAR
ncbi:hypothetical protein GCM10022403_071340 [Streptomyces coacervatus]|uniref:Uncharacterized protein n=1 Tax=Streptomyces coacervatus TaxID=647381 RepID=A0ABP7IWC9_9ACTN|nr:hypothetical protein [Streptomyces coacervatus]MDF2269739.1 hypothetical protein [Streptomyces coacervatus]